MRIYSWNVNSVRSRYDRLMNWLEANEPDVLCLQELKCREEEFPFEDIGDLGYEAIVLGQKTYNGVAILTRGEIADETYGFGDDEDDPQARFVTADIDGVRVCCLYAPNGGKPFSDKWAYKQRWYGRLKAWLEKQDPSKPLVLCGDFNIAPDSRDVKREEDWEGSVLTRPEARELLRGLTSWGLVDTFRLHREEGGLFSWWDYRGGSLRKNDGLRIDLVLATEGLAARCTDVFIDKDERKGEKPSDHVPVGAEFDWN